MDADIAIVISARDWAERLHRFVADHGGARVRARILDAREALEAPYAVLVAEDLTSFLTPRLVDDLHARGRRVIGLFDPAEPWGAQRLAELGVDERLPLDTTPEELLRAIDALVAASDLDAELEAFQTAVADEPRPTGPPGTLVAVSGPLGGTGATEVAIALAASVSWTTPTVLVDADDLAPSIAQRLGLVLHPNIRGAVDAVEHRTTSLEATLQTVRGARLKVLTGLPSPRDWHELRPVEVVALLDELRRRVPLVVVDVGSPLEEVAGLTGRGRFALARAVLGQADAIVAVGAPSPVGVARLLAWLREAKPLAPNATVSVAINRSPSGRFRRGELEHEIRRVVHLDRLVHLPVDGRVEQAAWDGTLVADGPFARAVATLATSLPVPAVAR